MTGDFSKQEEQAYRYVLEGNKEAAVQLLLDLVIRHSRKRNFEKAEFLREKIYEIDPMALSEILKAAEAIEDAKSEAIDRTHLDIWQPLNQTLTKEEENALYYALKLVEFPAETVIYNQGDHNSKLYFVNSGKLNILYRQGNREYFLKKLVPGDIVGDDTFFTASLCTTTLISNSAVKLKYIERDVLAKWNNDQPALDRKIHDYCLRSESISDLLKKKDVERRRHRRLRISGNVLVQLVSASGASQGKVLMGDLTDISAGGVSFLIKARKKETARLLLGKKMNIKVSRPTEDIDKNGVVIGVHYNPQEFRVDTEYSVHLKFDDNLDSQILWEIENTRPQK